MNYREKIASYFHQRDRGWMLSLLAVVCLIYLPFLGNPFIFDDQNFFNGVTSEYYAHSSFNFDLRWFAYATLGWTAAIFSDLFPHPFRFGNIFLHVTNSILLFYLLRQLLSVIKGDVAQPSATVWGAFLGALVFAIHPVAVYAAGYVVQRSILMATFFSLLMLFAYMRGLLSGQKRWLLVAVVAYFLAGFSKEHSVLMPAVLVAWTILLRKHCNFIATQQLRPLSRSAGAPKAGNPLSGKPDAELAQGWGEGGKQMQINPTPLSLTLPPQTGGGDAIRAVGMPAFICTWLAFTAIGLLLILRAKGVLGTPYEVMAGALFEQQGIVENTPMLHLLSALTQAGLFFKYLLLWLIPNPAWMAIDMREPFVTSLGAWQGWLGAGAFVAYGVFALWLLLRGGNKGLMGFALLYPWLLFMVELTSIRVQEPFVLYRSYLWMPGLMIFIPLLLQKLWEINFSQRRAVMVAGLIILLLLPLAWNRLWVFADNYRLWNEAVMLLSSNQVAGADRIYFNRGTAFSPDKKPGEAIADLEQAVKLSSHLAPLHYVLGIEYFNAIRYQDAIVQFNETIKLDPQNSNAYYAKGLIYKRLKDESQAIELMNKSCELKNTAACAIVGMASSAKR